MNSKERRSGSVTADALSWRSRYRLTLTLAVLVPLLGVIVIIFFDEMLAALREPDTFRTLIVAFGFWGPVAVIISMTLAIVFSPLPSAPIALASGAIYGHTRGTVYVLIGAEVGALATLAGIVPASLLLAHFGQELLTVESRPVSTLLLVLSLIVLVPLLLHIIRACHRYQSLLPEIEQSVKKFADSLMYSRPESIHAFRNFFLSI